MADLTTSPYTRTYSSFSGVDIVAYLANTRVSNLQGVSYSITREKAPIYVMGSANPQSFSRGKRGVAGSLIFVLFDRSAFYNIMQASLYVAHSDENQVRSTQLGLPIQSNAQNVDPNVEAYLATPIYADQIPPFDCVLTGANELGQIMTMSILALDLLNEGSGISIDDMVNEMAYTYVAQQVVGWKPVAAGASGIDIISLGGSVNLATIPALVDTQNA